jgi:hypothetical protein
MAAPPPPEDPLDNPSVRPGSNAAAAFVDDNEDDDVETDGFSDINGPPADEEWEDWQAGEGDDGEQADEATSLFEPKRRLPSVEAALNHDATVNGFDLRSYIVQVRPGWIASTSMAPPPLTHAHNNLRTHICCL